MLLAWNLRPRGKFGCICHDTLQTSNCETSDDCGAGSCCVPMRRFYIASKRAVVSKEKIKGNLFLTVKIYVVFIAQTEKCDHAVTKYFAPKATKTNRVRASIPK